MNNLFVNATECDNWCEFAHCTAVYTTGPLPMVDKTLRDKYFASITSRTQPRQCLYCGKMFIPADSASASVGYCTRECNKLMRGAVLRNKRQDPKAVERMRAALKQRAKVMGDPFKGVRGGNGRGMTRAHAWLADQLDGAWEIEYIIPTGYARNNGVYPTNYKIDLACIDKRIAIEVDGNSHKGYRAKERDDRKHKFLVDLAWTVLHFTNIDIEAAINGDTSIEEKIIDELKKYDIYKKI